MKKAISIILATIICFTFMTISVSANGSLYNKTECTCEDHFSANDEYCNCCLYCNNFNPGYRTSCLKIDKEGRYYVCCDECTGIWPCDCGCECCREHDEFYEDTNDNTVNDNEIPENISSGNIFDGLMDIFDKISDIINDIIARILSIFE